MRGGAGLRRSSPPPRIRVAALGVASLVTGREAGRSSVGPERVVTGRLVKDRPGLTGAPAAGESWRRPGTGLAVGQARGQVDGPGAGSHGSRLRGLRRAASRVRAKRFAAQGRRCTDGCRHRKMPEGTCLRGHARGNMSEGTCLRGHV